MWRAIIERSVEKYNKLMSTVEWNLITQTLDPNDSYVFIDKFWKNYNKAFPLHKITIKKKSALGLQRGSKNHQGRHSTFMNSYHKLPKLQKY